MRPISAVIITKNEERNIGRCLISLSGVADEVLVVDSYSTDRTVEICKRHGALVYQVEWRGYSATKNYANTLAKHDLILSLDADEALSPELVLSIRKAQSDNAVAYAMNRLNHYCGHWIYHTGWYPDRKVRLFDRRYLSWEGTVHEILKPLPAEVPFLNGNILHYTFQNVGEHLVGLRKYARLSSQEMLQKGIRMALIRAVTSPIFTFIKFYIIKRGFLDKWPGFQVSVISAYGTWLKYALVARIRPF